MEYHPNKSYYYHTSDYDKSGVYLMTLDSETYVGSTSQKFYQRWTAWISRFAKFENLSKYQTSLIISKIDKCPLDEKHYKTSILTILKFSVLEVVYDFDLLKEKEQYWLNTLKPTMNQNNAVAPDFYYSLKAPQDKKLNYSKSAKEYTDKRVLANRQTYIKQHIQPIIDTLLSLDSNNYTKGKWLLKIGDIEFRFPKLSIFASDHNLNRRTLDSLSRRRSNYELPISLVNTKSRV